MGGVAGSSSLFGVAGLSAAGGFLVCFVGLRFCLSLSGRLSSPSSGSAFLRSCSCAAGVWLFPFLWLVPRPQFYARPPRLLLRVSSSVFLWVGCGRGRALAPGRFGSLRGSGWPCLGFVRCRGVVPLGWSAALVAARVSGRSGFFVGSFARVSCLPWVCCLCGLRPRLGRCLSPCVWFLFPALVAGRSLRAVVGWP